jgi:uncharacterized protein
VNAVRRYSFIFIWLWCLSALAAEVIPPKPEHYFNDYANVVGSATASQFNGQLEDFERSTGNQIVVAVFPKMQSDSSIDDYTVRVARSWEVGQKTKNNGAVLFVFVQDHKMFIQVGYGLEGVLPDALCKQITEYEIKPHFKAGDYAGGLTAGVNAILAATRHEYKGTGSTIYEQKHHGAAPNPVVLIIVVVIVFLLIARMSSLSRRHGWIISSGGWGGFSSGGGWGGGFSGGGGGGGFSGGGFSGGGGSFGGGDAGSSW